MRIVITSGEPAGIGPDLCVSLATHTQKHQLVVLGNDELLAARARQLGLQLEIMPYRKEMPARQSLAGELCVLSTPLAASVACGKLNPANAAYVTGMLSRAANGCSEGEFAAMVTAPVNKGVINEAGIAFSGHTEYLAAHTGNSQPVMLLCSSRLRVALVTTHLPLAAVPGAINRARIVQTVRVLHAGLQRYFGCPAPHIMVLGLNPHAGEAGHLGKEEQTIIEPALAGLRAEGFRLTGPVPADTAFSQAALDEVDAVLAMYHDQGLPVLKYASFGHAVNVTLGLPIIRTSVDHGTALSLAGSGKADPSSLLAAISLAAAMADKSVLPGT